MPDTLTQSSSLSAGGALPSGDSLVQGLNQQISLSALGRIGTGGALLTSGGGGPVIKPKFTIFIQGVDVTQYIKANTLTGHSPLEGRGAATFTVINPVGFTVYRPNIGASVSIYIRTHLLFAGFIWVTDESNEFGLFLIVVKCVSWDALLDNHIVGKFYPHGMFFGSTLDAIVEDVTLRYLAQDGIFYDPTGTPVIGMTGDNTFNYISATQVMNQLANYGALSWRVDFHKVLRFFAGTTALGPCPISLADNDNQWVNMKIERTLDNYRNRQGELATQIVNSLWTDTFLGTDSTVGFYITTYSQTKATPPTIFLNGVLQIVVELADIAAGPWDFYYIDNGVGVQYNFFRPPLTGSDTIEVDYPSQLPGIVWVEDDTEIANLAAIMGTSGLFEAVDQGTDISDEDTATATAQGILDKYGKPTVTVTVDIPKALPGDPDIQPGQKLSINTTQPLVSADLIIDTVEWKEVDKAYIKYTLSCGDHLHRIKGYKYFTNIKTKLTKAKDRIVEKAIFVLAGTVNGLTNPGLQVGTPPGLTPFIIKKPGIVAYVTIVFQTPPATNPVVVDVIYSGTGLTIFAVGSVPTISVGSTSSATFSVFAANPFAVAKGETLTAVVLTADAAAMDGELDVVMYA